jgi:hypothetical protein
LNVEQIYSFLIIIPKFDINGNHIMDKQFLTLNE